MPGYEGPRLRITHFQAGQKAYLAANWCMEVRALLASRWRPVLSLRARPKAGLVSPPCTVRREGVGVPGCEGPCAGMTHFQVGQKTYLKANSGLVCLDVKDLAQTRRTSRRDKNVPRPAPGVAGPETLPGPGA